MSLPRASGPQAASRGADLDTLTLKCLQKDPKDRYQNAGELAEDLKRWLAGDPISARPIALPGRVWRKAKRNRTVSLMSAGLLLATVGLAVMQWRAVSRESRASELEQRSRMLESSERLRARVDEWAKRKLLFLALAEDLDTEPHAGGLSGCPGAEWSFETSNKSLKITTPDRPEEEVGQYLEVSLSVRIPGEARTFAYTVVRPVSYKRMSPVAREAMDSIGLDEFAPTEAEAPLTLTSTKSEQERTPDPAAGKADPLIYGFVGLIVVFLMGLALPIWRWLRTR